MGAVAGLTLNHSDLQQTKRRKDDSDVHFASKPNECPLDKLIHLCIEDGIRKGKLAASDMAQQQEPNIADDDADSELLLDALEDGNEGMNECLKAHLHTNVI